VLAPREIDEYLLPTERRVIRVRQHWASVWKELTKTALFVLAMVVIERYLPDGLVTDNVTFYLALLAVLRFTVLTILWWIERIVVTDKRLMISRGLITHNLGMMPLSKVTDLTFQRSLGGRVLGYGTIIVESAGQNQAFERISYVPRPDEVYEALSELIFGDKGRTRATGSLARPRWLR
jgi:Bacterial PH domain